MKIKLNAARVNAGLTQDEVAEKLKISKNTIVNYEKNRTIPNGKTLQSMADLYGVSVDDLIFFAD